MFNKIKESISREVTFQKQKLLLFMHKSYVVPNSLPHI